MSDTARTHTMTNDTVTLRVNGRDSHDGEATLTKIVDRVCGYTVHIVSINQRAAEYYGLHQPANVVGGLVRTQGRWSPTAYRDRAHLFNHEARSTSSPTPPTEYGRFTRCSAGGGQSNAALATAPIRANSTRFRSRPPSAIGCWPSQFP